MPSTIRDLTELTTVATDDYLLISDTSDVVNRDKRISTTNLQLPLPKKTGTPVANNLTSWNDANTIKDGSVAVSDIARLSQNQTLTGANLFQRGAVNIFGAFLSVAQSGYASRTVLASNVTKRIYGQYVLLNVTNAATNVGIFDIINGGTQAVTIGSGNIWTFDVSNVDNTLGIIRTSGGSQIMGMLMVGWV